jgi:hypothetical protein
VWSDPELVLDSGAGEYVLLAALGGGVALRDDPDDSGYAGRTVPSSSPASSPSAPRIWPSTPTSPPRCTRRRAESARLLVQGIGRAWGLPSLRALPHQAERR